MATTATTAGTLPAFGDNASNYGWNTPNFSGNYGNYGWNTPSYGGYYGNNSPHMASTPSWWGFANAPMTQPTPNTPGMNNNADAAQQMWNSMGEPQSARDAA